MTNSFLYTVYLFSLGDPDATTGVYASQYTPSSAKIIMGEDAVNVLRGFGIFASAKGVGLTSYDLDEGDIIKTVFNAKDEFWKVLGRKNVFWSADRWLCFQLALERMERPNFHILTTNLQGFETISSTDKFEDGFERLYVQS